MRALHAVRRGRLARSIIVVAVGFALLAVVAALGETASTLSGLLFTPARLGLSGLVALIIGLACLAAGLAGAVLAARSRLTDRQLLVLGLLVLLAVRLTAVLLIEAPTSPDGSAYQKTALRMMGEGFFFWYRPTGYPFLLAAAYQALGERSLAYELLNLTFVMAGGWLLFDLAKRLAGRQAAIVALVAYAVMPGLLLLTPVRLTDTVYATLVIAVCWAGSRTSGSGMLWAVVAGLLVAASQYVRPTGPLLLAALLVAALASATTWRRWILSAAAMVLTFVIAMLPAFAHNLTAYGDLSPSTSSYGGWSLYMGTNQASNGGWNATDAAFIHALPGSLWEQSAQAGRLGMERIAVDPLGFAGLAVRKFAVMWGREDFVVQYGMDFRLVGGPQGIEAGVNLLAQFAWLGLLLSVAAALLMMRRQRSPHPIVLVAMCIVLAEAVLHLFVEVKPRYHAHLEPLLLLIAATAVARWATRGWSWKEIRRGASGEPHDAIGGADALESPGARRLDSARPRYNPAAPEVPVAAPRGGDPA